MTGPGIPNGRAFGMNPKAVGSSRPWVDTSSASKLWHFHKSIHSLVIKRILLPVHSGHFKFNITSEIAYTIWKIHTNDAFSITTFFQQNAKVDLNPLNVNILGVVEIQLLWWTQQLYVSFCILFPLKWRVTWYCWSRKHSTIKNIALELHPCDICKLRYCDF